MIREALETKRLNLLSDFELVRSQIRLAGAGHGAGYSWQAGLAIRDEPNTELMRPMRSS